MADPNRREHLRFGSLTRRSVKQKRRASQGKEEIMLMKWRREMRKPLSIKLIALIKLAKRLSFIVLEKAYINRPAKAMCKIAE
jgi:hypothetical protein